MSTQTTKQNNPLVSILVPIYNVEKYLQQCLDSITTQTLREIEIILINDGSSDSSLEIIEDYAKKDKRIVILNKKNTGYGDSMNRGLQIAKGTYIGIVESDDWIEADMYEKLYKTAIKDQLEVIRSEFFYYSTKGGEKNLKSNMDFVPHNVVLSPKDEISVFMQQPSIWANLYLRSFLIAHNIKFLPTPGASYQDTSFTFKVYACANHFKIIDDAFYHYRIDGGSSSFQNTTKVYCICDEYEEIWKYVTNNQTVDQFKYVIAKMQFSGYKWNFNRLASPFAEEFFEKWRNDFIKLDKKGLIDRSLLSPVDIKILNGVLTDKCPKKDKPYVSIIVPVYNVEKYLAKCLDSLLAQTLTNIEIICVNDGSTDKSKDILDEYAKKDSRIIVITKRNGGLSSARNAGMEIARAEYIGFVDSDDWIEPDTYESAFYSISDSDIVCFGTNVTGSAMLDRRCQDIEYYRIKYEGQIELTDEIRLNIDVAAWNKLYSLKIIREHNLEFPIGKLYEDYSFYWKYISCCHTAFFIKEAKYNYLRRENSIMANTFNGNKRALDHLLIYSDIHSFITNTDNLSSTETLNAMFLNCFWFAYLNVPNNMKKKVLKIGTKTAIKCKLNSEGNINDLINKKYEQIDCHQTYTFKFVLLQKILNYVESSFGGNLSSAKKMIYGTKRAPTDKSDSVATTEWVIEHDNYYWIERWATVYDYNSREPHINWGKLSLTGNNYQHIPEYRVLAFTTNTELKITVTLWGAEIAVLQGPIIDINRAIYGTTIFDGTETYAISVDIIPSEGKICARAINIQTKKDYSNYCKILKIETRIY